MSNTTIRQRAPRRPQPMVLYEEGTSHIAFISNEKFTFWYSTSNGLRQKSTGITWAPRWVGGICILTCDMQNRELFALVKESGAQLKWHRFFIERSENAFYVRT